MKKRKPVLKYPISRKNQLKPLDPDTGDSARRDPETNVYIPSDEEVADAKAWVDFNKL